MAILMFGPVIGGDGVYESREVSEGDIAAWEAAGYRRMDEMERDRNSQIIYEAAVNSPADGEDDVFVFSELLVAVFRNGVNETRLGTINGNTFTFDSAPDEDDDIEGILDAN